MNIESLQNEKIKNLNRLITDNRFRKKSGVFVVEGKQENERALQFGFENVEFFICESIFGINHPEGKIHFVSSQVYEKLAYRGSSEGIIGIYKTKEFDLKNYPWQDSTWKWVKTENKLIREGVKPKIKDLRIADADGNDYSEDFITYAGARLWVVSNELEKASPAVLASISALAVQLEKEYKISSIGLTASSDMTTENIRHESNIMFPFYYCDATTLKTMVRSNPGVLLIQNGVIINKWAFRALPSAKEIATQINK